MDASATIQCWLPWYGTRTRHDAMKAMTCNESKGRLFALSSRVFTPPSQTFNTQGNFSLLIRRPRRRLVSTSTNPRISLRQISNTTPPEKMQLKHILPTLSVLFVTTIVAAVECGPEIAGNQRCGGPTGRDIVCDPGTYQAALQLLIAHSSSRSSARAF